MRREPLYTPATTSAKRLASACCLPFYRCGEESRPYLSLISLLMDGIPFPFCFLKALAPTGVIFLFSIIKFSSLCIDHSPHYPKRWEYLSSKKAPKPKTNPSLNY